MNRTQKIQLAQSENRTRMAELLDVETRSTEQDSDLETRTARARVLETDLQASLLVEPDPVVETRQEDGEEREIRELRGRVEFGDYVGPR